ncbi:MAG: hypothetical protein QW286_01745 [Candidatus Aenigmatarchaeota archaeon]
MPKKPIDKLSLYETEFLLDKDYVIEPVKNQYIEVEVPKEKYIESPQIIIDKGGNRFFVYWNQGIQARIADKFYNFREEKGFEHPLERVFYGKILRRAVKISDKQTEIVKYIMKKQERYLKSYNPFELKKLTQEDVEKDLGYDSSVVSRVLKNLSVQLPDKKVLFVSELMPDERDLKRLRGLYALRELKNKIKKWKPSDEKLVYLLSKKYGLNIKRRTVNKYIKEV